MSIKQITVFGGSGFVGRAIVRSLAKQGYLVKAASRRIELAEPLKTVGQVGQVTLVRANLRIPQSVAAAIAGSQAVINAAGIPFERPWNRLRGGNRQRYQTVHVEGAKTIASAAAAFGVERLVHISGLGTDQRGTSNRYVQSKIAAEDAVIRAFETATILRPSVMFGPGDAMFTRLAMIAAHAPFVPLVGNGSAKVQPAFVGDVGDAVAAVLARPDTAKSVFELGGPHVYSYREIAALVLREIDRKKPIIGLPAALMKFGAFFAEFLPVPPITRDQADLMTHDNVVRPGALGFAELGIKPTAAEAFLPAYLDRFRIGGRYNQQAPA